MRSNLRHALRPVAGTAAPVITRGLAAMIDGLYIRQALRADPMAPETAVDVLMHYLDTALREECE